MAGFSSRQIGKIVKSYGLYIFFAYGAYSGYSYYSSGIHTYKLQYSKNDYERQRMLKNMEEEKNKLSHH